MKKLRIMAKIYYDYEYLEEELKKYLNQIKQRVIELYRQAIEETIYNAHSPTQYKRTYQMLNSIAVKFENDKLIIYTDTANMSYYSAVDGRDATELVPWMLEQTGHMDGTGIVNLYHYYPERRFLERAKELIQNEFPDLQIEIIKEEPSIV